MSWKKALGFGALIWAIMFVVVSILVAYGFVASGGGSTLFSWLLAILSLVVTYVAAMYIAPKSSMEAIQYGLVFAVVGIILDFLISQRFAPGMFSSVPYWVTYVLMVFVPLLGVKKMPAQMGQQ